MNIFKCITTRRSVIEFEKKEVDDKLIGVILYMATHAPSAGNIQEWQFVVVKDEKQKKKLAEAAWRQKVLVEVPVVIVVCADVDRGSLRYGERGEELYSIQDTANATMILLLTANALGLASNWVGAFDEDSVKLILELPDNLRPVAMIPIGYSPKRPSMPRRIPFENLTHFDRYGKKYKISALQPRAKLGEGMIEPLSVYIDRTLEKFKKEEGGRKGKKKLTFEEFLRKLAK